MRFGFGAGPRARAGTFYVHYTFDIYASKKPNTAITCCHVQQHDFFYVVIFDGGKMSACGHVGPKCIFYNRF